MTAEFRSGCRLCRRKCPRCSDSEEWAVDTEAAVAAEVGAALRISQALAASRLNYARAMRERLPKVAEVFNAGDIGLRLFQTISYRTDLITDGEVLAAVDAKLVVAVPLAVDDGQPPCGQGRPDRW